jgi:hypothetical protein
VGRFCEIVFTILKGHVDGAFPASPSKPPNMVDACGRLAQAGSHFPRSIRIQIPRMLVALYEVRNNRNVGHVGGDVDPNHQDAAVVLAMSQWIMAELVRVFHNVDIERAAQMVEALVERTVPLIWIVNGRTRILNPGLSAKEKILVVLYANVRGLSGSEIGAALEYGNMSRLKREILPELHRKKWLDYDAKRDFAVLSPLGARWVEEQIDLNV